MQICMLVSAKFPAREGMGFYVWNLSRSLQKYGHRVTILTRGSRGQKDHEVIEGIQVRRPFFLPLYPFHVHLHAVFVDRLLHQVRSEFDILHLHTPLIKQPHVPVPSLLTVHTPMKADTASIRVSSLYELLIKLQAPISYRLEKELFERAGGITVVANSIAAELKAYGIDPSTVAVMGNGVDTELFMPGRLVERHPAGASLPYVLAVGRLAARKGFEDLVAAAELVLRSYPGVKFMIAGAGPLESRLADLIRTRGLDNKVILLGHIPGREALVDLYRRAAIFVHPAHYEGLPTVLLEAMACGCPVVSTAVSGALDVVENGVNGLLVPPRAPGLLAGTILRLLKEQGYPQSLGEAARRTIEERYSWSVVCQNYISQYEQLLGGSS